MEERQNRRLTVQLITLKVFTLSHNHLYSSPSVDPSTYPPQHHAMKVSRWKCDMHILLQRQTFNARYRGRHVDGLTKVEEVHNDPLNLICKLECGVVGSAAHAITNQPLSWVWHIYNGIRLGRRSGRY